MPAIALTICAPNFSRSAARETCLIAARLGKAESPPCNEAAAGLGEAWARGRPGHCQADDTGMAALPVAGRLRSGDSELASQLAASSRSIGPLT